MNLREGWVIFVEYLPPALVDLKDLLPVEIGMVITALSGRMQPLIPLLNFGLGQERLRHVFGEGLRYIHPESSDTSIAPESQSGQEIFANFQIVPVEIRLRLVEYM